VIFSLVVNMFLKIYKILCDLKKIDMNLNFILIFEIDIGED
jgi:hypothetical protein